MLLHLPSGTSFCKRNHTFVGTAEPFLDETCTFIDNLKNAGVEASIDIYNGMYHAFDMMKPNSDIGKEAIQKFEEHFEYAMNNYYAKQEN